MAEGRFLRLVQLQYTRPPRSDVVRQWQCVERTTTLRSSGGGGDGAAATRSGVDAVAVFAVVKSKGGGEGSAPRVLLVKQFRPPLGMHTVELPAGLVDGGEDPVVSFLSPLEILFE